MFQKALKIFIASITFLILLGGFFVFSGGRALAAPGINKQINFQGKVVNTDGTNVADGSYNFVFSIYTIASGGANIWTESKNLTVTDGIFQTNLGSVTALPGTVDFNSDNIFLGINFNANGEMTPRVQFTATPYAFNADLLDGNDWTAPGAIGSATPNSGIFTTLGVVESGGLPMYHTYFQGGDQIADITYTLPTLAPNGILRNTGGLLSWDTVNYVANPMTTVGDIIYGGVAGAPTRLGGAAGFLTSTGAAAPVWTATATDYFTQYALLSGRAGGQSLIGGTVANNVMTIQGNSAGAGNTATNSNITFKVGNNGGTTALALLNNGNADFNHNQAVNFRVENANGSVVTPTCDSANQGRMYYDTGSRSAFVCIENSPGVYSWFDYTTTSVQSNKVVTVGTGGDYATIAAGAGYLSALGGGIILLTPETHNVTSAVDLSNMSLIGANTGDTRINVSGAGSMRVKETQFKSMTIYVDAGIAASSAIDVKYSAATTTSVIFEWVDFITNGTKVLVNSSEATAPTVRTRFISTSTTSGTQKIFLPKASANLNAASTHFVESQGGNGTLDIEDWNVKISGSSNVKTSGAIETIPDSTIFVYPGMNLQGAINSISSGGIITLLPGVHNISSTLLIDQDDIQIEGYGDASIVRAAGFTGSDTTGAIQIGSVDGSTPSDGVVLKDFRLEVSGTGATDIHGIRMAGGEDNQLLNLTVIKTVGASGTAAGARMGMLIMDGTTEKLVRPVVKGCRVLGTQSAVAYFTDGIHVTGGATYGAGSGIFTNGQGIEGALVDGNYVDYVRETVAVFVGVNNSSLFNNRFSRMGAGGGGAFGVFFGNSSNVNMTSNVVATSLSAASYALVIDSINSGSLKQVTDSVFNANAIDGSANGGTGFQYGVNIGNATNTAFHRNILTNNIINGASNAATTALTVTGDADDNNFSGNVFNGINNPWDTGFNIVNNTAERNFIGKNAFINTTANIADTGTATQMGTTQHNGAVVPVATDDNTKGYSIGAIWVNSATQNAYIATSVATGAAIWEQIDAVGGAGSTLQAAYTADADGGNANIVLTAADGSLVLQNVAGTQFAVNMTPATAPTIDLASILNTGAGQGAATTGVDGVQIDFANGGAAAIDNAGMRVNVTSNNNIVGTTLEGISIGNIAGLANAVESAIRIGTGWDAGIRFDTNGIIDVNNAANSTLSITNSGAGVASVSIEAGGSYTGAGAVTYGSGAGSGLTINSGTTGAIAIGDDSSAETISVGNGAAAKTIIIGSTNTTSMTTIQSGSGGLAFDSNSASNSTVSIANNGAGTASVSIEAGGSYTGAGAVTYGSGAGSGLTINSGTTGAIAIGDDSSAETINVGTGAAVKTIILGSNNTTSATTIQAGTGGIALQAAGAATGNVQVGTGGAGSATPDILALDVKSNVGDPAGFEGAMYYNTADNKFRCYQGAAWTDCIADSVSVNGVAANNANFSDATVAAPNGGTNVKWQKDAVNPDNISAYFDFGNYEQAFKKKPTDFSDFMAGPTATYNMPFLGAAITAGTNNAPTAGVVNGDHPGVVRLRSSTTANGGYRLQAYNGSIRLKGGEVFEGILYHNNIATTTVRMGFNDNTTSADAVDGCYFEIATTGIARGKCANNNARTTTTGSYTIALNTWYTYRITMNANATLATFEIFNSAGTSLFTVNNTVATNIPTAAGRETNVGMVATESTTTATDMLHLDYMGFNLGTTNALAR